MSNKLQDKNTKILYQSLQDLIEPQNKEELSKETLQEQKDKIKRTKTKIGLSKDELSQSKTIVSRMNKRNNYCCIC